MLLRKVREGRGGKDEIANTFIYSCSWEGGAGATASCKQHGGEDKGSSRKAKEDEKTKAEGVICEISKKLSRPLCARVMGRHLGVTHHGDTCALRSLLFVCNPFPFILFIHFGSLPFFPALSSFTSCTPSFPSLILLFSRMAFTPHRTAGGSPKPSPRTPPYVCCATRSGTPPLRGTTPSAQRPLRTTSESGGTGRARRQYHA